MINRLVMAPLRGDGIGTLFILMTPPWLCENISRYFTYKYKMSYKNGYSPYCNINKYVGTYVINNCINSLHSGSYKESIYGSRW